MKKITNKKAEIMNLCKEWKNRVVQMESFYEQLSNDEPSPTTALV